MANVASLLPLVGIALLFWLLMIRPAQRRQRELGRMQSAVDVGDEVMLTSGIFATVTSVGDDRIGVEVASGVELEVVRGAIGTVVTKVEQLPEEPERSDSVSTETTETTETGEER
ncbi:MAG: preprotein translocase subunit YajC [Nocardioides sp.]